MMKLRDYRLAFLGALLLHLSLVVLMLSEHSSERPVLKLETQNEPGQSSPELAEPQQAKAIQAVSVDSQEVMQTVNRLKQERLHQQQVEVNRQRVLNQQAALARKQRLEEQQRLEKLKSEAAKLAIARQKQMAEEQQHLKDLALQKKEQEKHLAEMKQQQAQLQKQQQLEAQKLAELQKKKTEEVARAEAARLAKIQAEKAQKQQAASQQAALDAAKAARVAGEVDKYKAMIISAISRQWILPENVDSSLSSQFRIRLAPNGAVLEVSLMRSSGDSILDRSAQAAIYKASPLPVPTDATTFDLFRDISLTVRPMGARG